MRPLQRLNFVLRQDTDLPDHEDVSFASLDGADDRAGPEASIPKPTLVAKSAHPLNPLRGTQAKRKWLITGEPREESREESRESRDAEIAERMVNLVRELNRAMDDALKQGLIVEPALSRVKGRYGAGEEDGSYVLSLKLFRKLC